MESLADKEKKPAGTEAPSGERPGPGSPGELHGRIESIFEESETAKLALVKDIPVTVTAVLGKTSLPLGKLFALGRGGIIDLHCLAGEPVEILVNNRPVGRGEVVAVNDELGVRITVMHSAALEPADQGGDIW